MTTQAAERTTLTLPQIEALPAVAPAQPTICAVWGIAPSMYFKLLAADQLPVETFTIGRNRKVLRASILRAIGEDNGDGPGGATPDPLAETHHSTV